MYTYIYIKYLPRIQDNGLFLFYFIFCMGVKIDDIRKYPLLEKKSSV